QDSKIDLRHMHADGQEHRAVNNEVFAGPIVPSKMTGVAKMAKMPRRRPTIFAGHLRRCWPPSEAQTSGHSLKPLFARELSGDCEQGRASAADCRPTAPGLRRLEQIQARRAVGVPYWEGILPRAQAEGRRDPA